MKILQNRTVFVISTLFFETRVRMSLYIYERGASFERVWEPMT